MIKRKGVFVQKGGEREGETAHLPAEMIRKTRGKL